MRRMRPRSGLLSRLVKLVRPSRPGHGAPPAPKPAAAPPPQDLTADSFRLAIQQVMQEDDGQYQTKLQIISLIEFRSAVGDKWVHVADKVMMIAEGVIQLHIGPGNVFGRQGQDLFTLLFRTCSHAEARQRALNIAKDLGTRLVGDKVLGADRPLALAAEVPLAGALNPDGSLNPAVIAQAVDEMRSILAVATQEAADEGLRSWMKPSQEQPRTPEEIRAHMRPGAPRAPEAPLPLRASMAPSRPPPPPSPAAEPAKAPSPAAPSGIIPLERHQRPAPEWKPFTVDAAWGSEILVDGPRPLPPEVRLSLLWRPTWVAGNETIGAFRAHLQRVDRPEGGAALEGSLAYTGGNATSQKLDNFAIGAAMRAFRATQTAGIQSLIILPVHWDSIYTARRMDFLAPLADATAQSRSARLIIELFGVPADVAADNLATAIGVLRGLCRTVILRTMLGRPMAPAAAAGANLIGIDLSDLPEAERTDDAHLLDRLRDFRTQAESAQLGAFVWGVRRRKVITGAVVNGFALVNGPALVKDIARPANAVPAPRERLIATV